MARNNNRYSREFKVKVVKKYLEGAYSIQELADEFKIPSKTQIHNWLKKYEKEGEEGFKFETRGNPKVKKEAKSDFIFENLEDEVQFLKMENEYLKKFCDLLKSKIKG